jgi:hypothetical protein
MDTLEVDGYTDTLGHNPTDRIIFFGMHVEDTMDIEGWQCNSVYVHDTRHANGSAPDFHRVRAALPSLRDKMKDAAPQLMIWPDGREGARHVVGGGWITGKVTFYIARGLVRGKWGKVLCANVY